MSIFKYKVYDTATGFMVPESSVIDVRDWIEDPRYRVLSSTGVLDCFEVLAYDNDIFVYSKELPCEKFTRYVISYANGAWAYYNYETGSFEGLLGWRGTSWEKPNVKKDNWFPDSCAIIGNYLGFDEDKARRIEHSLRPESSIKAEPWDPRTPDEINVDKFFGWKED